MVDNEKQGEILAIVTQNRDMMSDSVPVFFTKEEKEMEKLARYISKVLNAATHDLENGTFIIVRH